MLAAVPEHILEAGKCNKVLSLTIMQTISSEYNLQRDLDKDLTTFLMKLINKFKETWPGKVCSRYIQVHSMQPFMIVLFTKKVLRHVLTLDQVLCYLDSTGSVVARPWKESETIYYYALTIPGNEECSPLPIAECISSVHNIPYITYFLSLVNYALKGMTSRTVIINEVETDFSLALIQGVVLSFYGISVSRYIEVTYAYIHSSNDRSR